MLPMTQGPIFTHRQSRNSGPKWEKFIQYRYRIMPKERAGYGGRDQRECAYSTKGLEFKS